MKKEIYNVEGIEIEVEKTDMSDKEVARRMTAYAFSVIRNEPERSHTDFAKWLGIPYRTIMRWIIS